MVIYDAHNAETVIQSRAISADILEPKRWLTAFYSIVQLRRIKKLELVKKKLLLHIYQSVVFTNISLEKIANPKEKT